LNYNLGLKSCLIQKLEKKLLFITKSVYNKHIYETSFKVLFLSY